jgi:hypothetical protein
MKVFEMEILIGVFSVICLVLDGFSLQCIFSLIKYCIWVIKLYILEKNAQNFVHFSFKCNRRLFHKVYVGVCTKEVFLDREGRGRKERREKSLLYHSRGNFD